MAISHLLLGVVLCLTIIGIPLDGTWRPRPESEKPQAGLGNARVPDRGVVISLAAFANPLKETHRPNA